MNLEVRTENLELNVELNVELEFSVLSAQF
jgi:hypothetical protein